MIPARQRPGAAISAAPGFNLSHHTDFFRPEELPSPSRSSGCCGLSANWNLGWSIQALTFLFHVSVSHQARPTPVTGGWPLLSDWRYGSKNPWGQIDISHLLQSRTKRKGLNERLRKRSRRREIEGHCSGARDSIENPDAGVKEGNVATVGDDAPEIFSQVAVPSNGA